MAAVLLVVGNSAGLTAADTAVQSRLTTTLGHTVTLQSASAASYTTSGKNLVVISSGQAGTKLDAATIPVVGMISSVPHSKFCLGTTSPGTVSSYYVALSSDPVTTPDASGSTVVFASGAMTSLYTLTTQLGTTAIAPLRYSSSSSTRVMGAYYASGALLSDGTTAAPSFRGALQNIVAFDLNNANGQRWFDQMVALALASFIAPPTASAGPDQTHAVGKLCTMAFSGTAPGSTIGSYTARVVSAPAGSTATLSSTSTTNPTITPDLPGSYVIGVITTNTAAPATSSAEATMTLVAVAPAVNSGADSSQTVAPANVALVATLTGVGVTGSWVQGIPGTANPSTVTILAPTSGSTSFFPPSVSGTYKFHFDGTDEAGTAVTGSTVTMVFGSPVLGALNVRVYNGAGSWV